MSSNLEKNDPGQSCEFQENLNILRQVPVFSPLPLDTLKVFAYLCDREMFTKGDLLFKQNEDDGQALHIISGEAVLVYEGETGEVEFTRYGTGDFIGGLTLMGKAPRLFSLKALTDMSCLIMRREKFIRAVEQFPEIMPRILHALVDRIYRWEKKLLAEHAETCNECIKRIGVSLV
jgi:CRP-like cAMP-binding protein